MGDTRGLSTDRYTYGYDVHGNTSLLVNQSGGSVGQPKASYGYRPYGDPDTALTLGDPQDDDPVNPMRYSARRYDSGSGSLDMGARRYQSAIGRFLQFDQYGGALADLSLSSDPLTGNRYALAGGNPVGFMEWDGHIAFRNGCGTGSCAGSDPDYAQLAQDSDSSEAESGARSTADYSARTALREAYLRDIYHAGDRAIQQEADAFLNAGRDPHEIADWANQARNELRATIRSQGNPALDKWLAHTRGADDYPTADHLRAGGKSDLKIIEGAGRTNEKVNALVGEAADRRTDHCGFRNRSGRLQRRHCFEGRPSENPHGGACTRRGRCGRRHCRGEGRGIGGRRGMQRRPGRWHGGVRRRWRRGRRHRRGHRRRHHRQQGGRVGDRGVLSARRHRLRDVPLILMPSVWSLSAVEDGVRIRLFGPGNRGRVVFEAADESRNGHPAELALWAAQSGALVVRMPGTLQRPVILVDPETGVGRAVPELPFEVRSTSTDIRFHPWTGGKGVLTLLQRADPWVVWRLPIDGHKWMPLACPSGLAVYDTALRGDRLWAAGNWPTPELRNGAPAIIELSPSGEVLHDLPIGTAGWKKRYGPLNGPFFGVDVGPGGSPVVGVNPRLWGPEDDKVYVWIHGQWTRFDEWVTAVDIGPADVTLFFRDGWMRTWTDGQWSKKVPLPIDKPLQGVVRRGSTIVVADSSRISASTDGGRTYSSVGEADSGEQFQAVAFGPG
ncbi:MAG TPA: RHS repeat-associated core domain-containing protein [Mycobacteriales bacterium]|nr:RHS repeat-associated core domain-containing protein [Mycobacteriales bacterium]